MNIFYRFIIIVSLSLSLFFTVLYTTQTYEKTRCMYQNSSSSSCCNNNGFHMKCPSSSCPL